MNSKCDRYDSMTGSDIDAQQKNNLEVSTSVMMITSEMG